MRPLRAAAIAGLHSLGKGANRTPPDRAVCRFERAGLQRGLTAAAGGFSAVFSAGGSTGTTGKDFTP
jgi:hypothetical protein